MNPINFDFNSHPVRVVSDDPFNPLFVAKDVAEALGYKNSNKAINDHCKGVTKQYPLETLGGRQSVNVICEADMYRLIFGSKLKSAVKFQDWVFSVVLPTIRQTGSFQSKPNQLPAPEAIDPRDKYISPAMQSHLQEAVSGVVKASRGFTSFQSVWKKLNQQMGVASYKDILKADYCQACRVLGVKPRAELVESKKAAVSELNGVKDGCYMVSVKGEHIESLDSFADCMPVDRAFFTQAMNNLKVISDQVSLAMAVPHRYLKR